MSEKILAGRYRLVEKIGEGGMAIVYRAIDQNTGHSVAIKMLKPELSQDADYVSRFQREAEAASKMTHHNIVNLLDVGMDGNNRYLVMEYVQGITLKQLIQQRGRLSPTTAAQITIRILSALEHAHANGIIHRDIKPQNILVASDGHIKVADFGIARIANSYTLTRNDSVMGTVYYYSPEQASAMKVGATSDIYSVGVAMYEMLTGRVPFSGETPVAIAMQHLHAKPEPIEKYAPEVPPAIAHVVMMAMAKDPHHRYQSAKEMAMELNKALAGRVSEMRPRSMGNDDFPVENISAAQDQKQKNGNKRSKIRRKKPITRRQAVWWSLSVLMALMVGYGLYIGGISIYEKVVNTAPVPDLEGIEIARAERLASLNGLNVEVVEINHPTISTGTVIMQAPGEGTTLQKGDAVVLTVSKGPASQTVPKLVGLTHNDANLAAESYGLKINAVYGVSSDVQEGFVLTQTPAAGTPCQNGDTIMVTVSGGLINTPDVKGRLLPDAISILESYGLSVSSALQYVDTDDAQMHGRVAAQSSEAGLPTVQGTSVTLTVYQVPGMRHDSEVEVRLPQSEKKVSLRVSIVENQAETTVYQGEFAPEDSREVTVTITSQMPGSYLYRVYFDEKFTYQDTVVIE